MADAWTRTFGFDSAAAIALTTRSVAWTRLSRIRCLTRSFQRSAKRLWPARLITASQPSTDSSQPPGIDGSPWTNRIERIAFDRRTSSARRERMIGSSPRSASRWTIRRPIRPVPPVRKTRIAISASLLVPSVPSDSTRRCCSSLGTVVKEAAVRPPSALGVLPPARRVKRESRARNAKCEIDVFPPSGEGRSAESERPLGASRNSNPAPGFAPADRPKSRAGAADDWTGMAGVLS